MQGSIPATMEELLGLSWAAHTLGKEECRGIPQGEPGQTHWARAHLPLGGCTALAPSRRLS